MPGRIDVAYPQRSFRASSRTRLSYAVRCDWVSGRSAWLKPKRNLDTYICQRIGFRFDASRRRIRRRMERLTAFRTFRCVERQVVNDVAAPFAHAESHLIECPPHDRRHGAIDGPGDDDPCHRMKEENAENVGDGEACGWQPHLDQP